MPGKLDKIIKAIGVELAATLCHTFAGQGICIHSAGSNRKVKPGSDFQAVIDCIGSEAAALLAKEALGVVYIPQFKAELDKQRRQEIIDNYKGERIEDYALMVGLSARRIYQIFKESGVSYPPKPIRTKQVIDYAGETAREYADKHGIHVRTARSRLKASGITPCSGL